MMPQTPTLRNQAKLLPKSPGVYLFKSETGAVIYVGKAKNLRSRTGQYWGHDSRPQIPFLLKEAKELDYTVSGSELEALYLENSLIKQYKPKYNVMLRDDKNYAFIKIDTSTEIPSISYVRTVALNDKYQTPNIKQIPNSKHTKLTTKHSPLPTGKYFGPYSSVARIRQVLNAVERVLPLCKNTKLSARPCFNYHLHRCPGVCFGKVSIEEYKITLTQIGTILSGQTRKLEKDIRTQMQKAAGRKKFELAARLRDQLSALHMLTQKQMALFPALVNWDFVSTFSAYGDVCVNLFKVREGKLMDKENFIYQEKEGESVLERFLEHYYAEASDLPKSVYIECAVGNHSLIEALLKTRSGKTVSVEVPSRGSKQKLIKLGSTNAEESLRKWQTTQAQSLDRLREVLLGLQKLLGLPTLPKRIECYDISNTQGTNPVGSMVVFEDGLPAKSQYRKFAIKGKSSPDDFAMMREMLTRRIARLEVRGDRLQTGKIGNPTPTTKNSQLKTTTWPQPDLIVIDGGKPQLGVVYKVIQDSGFKIPVIGLAKRIEEIFLPHKNNPILLPHDNPILHILQRLRDEAHRFAIAFHKQKRSKQATRSALDDIPGIGPKTKKLLKLKFGTLSEIKQANPDELEKLIGAHKYEQLKKYL